MQTLLVEGPHPLIHLSEGVWCQAGAPVLLLRGETITPPLCQAVTQLFLSDSCYLVTAGIQ